ncbi:MAG: hypothetical protein SNJ70_09870 [Armatimonadota bacterium]
MNDKKLMAIILGGIAGIGIAVALGSHFYSQHKEEKINVDEIFDEAKEAVKKLNETLESIKATAKS